MTTYSKEYCESHKIASQPSFSIEEEFQKLKEDTRFKIKCDGYGIIEIINRDNDCLLILKDGKEISYEELTNKSLVKKETYWRLILLIIGVLIAWAITVSILKCIGYTEQFSGVDSLFSGLALAAIIYTIFLQKKELKLQRKDLKLTRDELKLTRNEFSTQNETLKQQRFENTFFQMLTLHHEIVDKLVYTKINNGVYPQRSSGGELTVEKEKNEDFEKREVLKHAKENLIQKLKSPSNEKNREKGSFSDDIYSAYKKLQSDYESFFDKDGFEYVLSHYFRNLYHIFKYIHLSNLEDDEKKFYASLVRAQISPDELFIIYYNVMIPGLGNPKFLYLVEEYQIMENFNETPIDEFNDHTEIFEILSKESKHHPEVLKEKEPEPFNLSNHNVQAE
ncbi:MAG: putative phage abortive infection protein [Fluviicola sp.]|nr:putative phage abortive infection protein [Fluviicola sp.]